MEHITEVCRLCLEKKILVWIFDTRIRLDDIAKIVYLTTGVKISSDDEISQKVCTKCLQVAAKMYEFRLASQKSDSTLKAKHKVYVEKNRSTKSLYANTATEKHLSPANSNLSSAQPEVNNKDKKIAISVHPSIKQISATYLNIMIPRKCLKLDMLPVVSLAMNEVENYFEKKNIDFQKHARQILRSVKRDVNIDLNNAQGNDSKLTTFSSENTENHPSKLDVVMPIKIATNKSGYAIVSKAQPSRNAEAGTNKYIDEANSNKRKLSESETESPTVNKKIINKNDTSTLQIGKSVPLYICDICNSVQYSLNVLNKHKLKHLICQFCKTRFKSMEKKQQHLEKECAVKKMKSSCLVTSQVKLERIELVRSIREKYTSAFAGFPLLPDMKVAASNEKDSPEKTSRDNDTCAVSDTKHKKIDNSIIEIIDDDESDSLAASDTNQKKLSQKSTNKEEEEKINTNSTNRVTAKFSKTKVIPFPDSSLKIHSSSFSRNNDNNTVITPEIVTSVSVVKPNIRIKNNTILDHMDPKASDIKLMHDLLNRYKNVNGCLDQSTQTELLLNSSIVINQNEVTTEFKGLKNLLHFYKIPVVIKNGKFSVAYTNERVEEKKKNMCLWDDLEPVDIAEPKKTPITEQVHIQQHIAQDSSNLTLSSLLNRTSTETLSTLSLTDLVISHPGNVPSGTQKEDCRYQNSKTCVIIEPSASLQRSPHENAEQGAIFNPPMAQIPNAAARIPNTIQILNDFTLSRTSSVEVLKSTALTLTDGPGRNSARSSGTTGSLVHNPQFNVIEKYGNISETIGSLPKTVHHPIVQSAIPKIGHPISQSMDTFQTVANNQEGVPSVFQFPNDDPQLPQASRSCKNLTIHLPRGDLQSATNNVMNPPCLNQVNSAEESTSRAISGNKDVETPIPAQGSIRVKNLVDLT